MRVLVLVVRSVVCVVLGCLALHRRVAVETWLHYGCVPCVVICCLIVLLSGLVLR